MRQRVAVVERIGPGESAEGLFDVVGDEGLCHPVMTVGGKGPAIVKVIQEHELLGDSMVVRRDLTPELHQDRIAVTLRQSPKT